MKRRTMPGAVLSVLLLGWGIAAGSGQTPPAALVTNNAAPAPSVVYDNESMTYGQEQVNQLLADRPQLASLMHDDNAIETWAVKAFASPDIDFRLVWNGKATTSGPDNSSESSGFPDAMNRSTISIDGIWKSGARAGVKRTAEEILENLVFEVANARNGRIHAALEQRALRGEVDRETYIQNAAHDEFDAFHAVNEFRKQIWLPYCHDTSTIDSPSVWKKYDTNNFDEWMKRYPRTYWYPWQLYGARYDKAQAYRYQTTLAAAEKGDAAAQARMGVMLGWVGLYKDSAAWFLKSANQGNASAENAMQWICYYGVGAPKDEAQAFSWAKKSADQGDAKGEKTVAWFYRWGVGVQADPAAAKIWEDKAAAAAK